MNRGLWVAAVSAALAVGNAQAHRVNVFAWVEGQDIVVEGKFQGGAKAKGSRVTVESAGKSVLSGRTGDDGQWRAKLPGEAIGQALTVVVEAGEGHRNTWTLEPAETAAAGAAKEPAPAECGDVQAAVLAERARIEERVVAPLRRELAESRNREPGWIEVTGGIGWIVGLFGALAWWRRRKG